MGRGLAELTRQRFPKSANLMAKVFNALTQHLGNGFAEHGTINGVQPHLYSGNFTYHFTQAGRLREKTLLAFGQRR